MTRVERNPVTPPPTHTQAHTKQASKKPGYKGRKHIKMNKKEVHSLIQLEIQKLLK